MKQTKNPNSLGADSHKSGAGHFFEEHGYAACGARRKETVTTCQPSLFPSSSYLLVTIRRDAKNIVVRPYPSNGVKADLRRQISLDQGLSARDACGGWGWWRTPLFSVKQSWTIGLTSKKVFATLGRSCRPSLTWSDKLLNGGHKWRRNSL